METKIEDLKRVFLRIKVLDEKFFTVLTYNENSKIIRLECNNQYEYYSFLAFALRLEIILHKSPYKFKRSDGSGSYNSKFKIEISNVEDLDVFMGLIKMAT